MSAPLPFPPVNTRRCWRAIARLAGRANLTARECAKLEAYWAALDHLNGK